MARSTLTISGENKTRFDSFKDSSETVDQAFGRLLDAATGELTEGDSGGAGVILPEATAESEVNPDSDDTAGNGGESGGYGVIRPGAAAETRHGGQGPQPDSTEVDAEDILARLDDLQAELPKRTADAVENRMTRR